MALFPTPAEVEASTPATRDRAIDVVRIVSLVGVVVGHTIMATSIVRDDVFVQLVIMAALVALVFVTLRPLENNPLPLWDGGLVRALVSAARRSGPCCASRARRRWRRSAGASRTRVSTASR